MSFGIEQSQKASDQTLTGSFVSKITQSREDARAEKKRQEKIESEGGTVDQKDKKNLFRKALVHNMGGGFLGGKKSFSENFNYKKPLKDTSKGESPKSGSGGAAPGLIKILVDGFGILSTDTTQIQGSLGEIAQTLNGQLAATDFTANNLTGVQSILSDQLENQVSIIEALGGVAPTGSNGSQEQSSFGTSKSKAASSSTLTGFLKEKIDNLLSGLGGGALGSVLTTFGRGLLMNPWVLAIGGGLIVGMIAAEALKRKAKFSETPITDDPEKDKKIRETLPPTLGGTSQVSGPQHLPAGDPRRWRFDNPGKPVPKDIQDKINAMPKAGPWQNFASGGINSMIGEAGKEQVIDLNSADARNSIGGDQGNSSMKAVGGSLLSVVDQFLSAMGPLGDPVKQAMGAEASSLAREFGIAQSLSNLSVSGSKFKDNTQSKRQRDSFMKTLVSKSLQSLGAKKDDKKTPTAKPKNQPPPPQPPNPNSRNPQARTPGPTGEPSGNATGNEPEFSSPSVEPTNRQGTKLKPSQGAMESGRDQVELAMPGYDNNFVLFNRKDGRIEVHKKGLFGVGSAGLETVSYEKDANGNYKDKRLAVAYNEVRANILNQERNNPALIQKALKWGYITPTDVKNKIQANNPRNNEIGGVNVGFDRGGTVLNVLDSLGRDTFGQMNKTYSNYVRPKAESGMVEPAWWDIGGRINRWLDEQTYPEKYNKKRAMSNNPYFRTGDTIRQMRNEGTFSEGGTTVMVDGHRINVDKNGYPDKDGFINPLGYGWGIPNPFVSESKRSALAKQREAARNRTPWGMAGQVMRGERLITGGTVEDLQRARGYESGGSSKSAFGISYSNQQVTIDDRVERLEKTMKYIIRSIDSGNQQQIKRPAPRTSPSSSPVSVSNQQSESMDSATIINVIASSGGGSQSVPVNTESSFSTAEYMSDPWPSGMAGVLCSSPWGVYK